MKGNKPKSYFKIILELLEENKRIRKVIVRIERRKDERTADLKKFQD